MDVLDREQDVNQSAQDGPELTDRVKPEPAILAGQRLNTAIDTFYQHNGLELTRQKLQNALKRFGGPDAG